MEEEIVCKLWTQEPENFDEERRLMHLVPAPAVRLMKRQVLIGSSTCFEGIPWHLEK